MIFSSSSQMFVVAIFIASSKFVHHFFIVEELIFSKKVKNIFFSVMSGEIIKASQAKVINENSQSILLINFCIIFLEKSNLLNLYHTDSISKTSILFDESKIKTILYQTEV
jgi:hypothetical protein